MNFRLEAKNKGPGYTDMFPQTSINALVKENGPDFAGNLYRKEIMTVTIPTTTSNYQSIPITTDELLVAAPVTMFLKSTGESAQKAYNTISQFEVKDNELEIVRLYDMPTIQIEVTLLFFVKVPYSEGS